jgi:disulfide bond formation protein DsbB
LFFSNVLNLPPCVLCWFQRICMYPIIALATVGILRRDKGLAYYVLPLSIIGFLISLYHNLLYYGILPESIAPCRTGVSCTTRQIELLGFITIPLLSFTAFAIITTSMILYLRQLKLETQSSKSEKKQK